jgi:predicted RND superfamily exporter protein
LVTPDSQNANLTFYLVDHRGETLRKVVAAAKEFIAAHPIKGAKFRLAGGLGGLTSAINEVVMQHQAQVTILAFSIVFIFCGIAYRSILAGILFLIPLLISNYLTYALMGARQIGLDVNALPVVALGVGLGVDYGLYVVDRIKEEYERLHDLQKAVVTAITTAGKAVTFTAATMVAGVAFWTMSFMRFQADMGLLLVFWMVISMLGGLIILPTLIVLLKPRFVVGKSA